MGLSRNFSYEKLLYANEMKMPSLPLPSLAFPCLPLPSLAFPCLPLPSRAFPCLPMLPHTFPCLPLPSLCLLSPSPTFPCLPLPPSAPSCLLLPAGAFPYLPLPSPVPSSPRLAQGGDAVRFPRVPLFRCPLCSYAAPCALARCFPLACSRPRPCEGGGTCPPCPAPCQVPCPPPPRPCCSPSSRLRECYRWVPSGGPTCARR